MDTPKKRSIFHEDTHLETDKSYTSGSEANHFNIRAPTENKNIDHSIVKQQQKGMSKTQQELRSHSIIDKILTNSRLKVINHNMKPFNHKMELYRKYNHQKAKTDGSFASGSQIMQEGSSKIQQAFDEINDKTSTALKMKRSFSHSIGGQKKPSKKYNKSQQISISGLISYEFRSINSKNRLALTPQAADNEMMAQIVASKKRSRASIDRQYKIHMKTDPTDKIQKDLNQAIGYNYGSQVSTEQYLKAFMREKRNSVVVYGQPAKQYTSLKKLSKEVPQLDQAYFMVEKIKQVTALSTTKAQQKARLGVRTKNDQLVFEKRRIPQSKKRITTGKIIDPALLS